MLGKYYIEKALFFVIVPLYISTSANGYDNSYTLPIFHFCLVVLIIAIYFKIDSTSKQMKLERNNNNLPKLEIVNRAKIPAVISYNTLLGLASSSKTGVQIISPPKSSKHNDESRNRFFLDLEKVIKAKVKLDNSFSYKRLIPVSNDSELENDKGLYNHFNAINSIALNAPNVICKTVPQLYSQYHFMIIDAKILVLFFPKFLSKSDETVISDECAIHFIIKCDEAHPTFRFLRSQHHALAR